MSAHDHLDKSIDFFLIKDLKIQFRNNYSVEDCSNLRTHSFQLSLEMKFKTPHKTK